MKILLAVSSLSTILSSSIYKSIKVEKNNSSILTSSVLDEDSLETEVYKAGEKPYKAPIITFDEMKLKSGTVGYTLSLDYKVLKELILKTAKESGLLNGETRYEKLGDENLFMYAQEFLGTRIEVIKQDGSTGLTNFWMATVGQMLLEETPSLNIIPLNSIKQLRISFNPNFNAISFGDKRLVKIKKDWGWINYGSKVDSELSLETLFQKKDLSESEEDSYSRAYSDFTEKLRIEFKENNRVFSNDFEITWSNQGSEKQSLTRGYNIGVEINNEFNKAPFPIDLLLLPMLLMLIPLVYFGLRKILKK